MKKHRGPHDLSKECEINLDGVPTRRVRYCRKPYCQYVEVKNENPKRSKPR